MQKYKTIFPHKKISLAFNNVYCLVGSMKLFGIFKYSRNMVILKQGDDLCLVNPVRLNAEEEQVLLKMGNIHSILKLGRLHSVDIPYYMDKFSPKLWGSGRDSFLLKFGYTLDIDIEETLKLPFLNIQIFNFKTSKENEAVAFLPQDNGILLSCDAFVNMKKDDPMANWLVRMLSKTLPSPVYIGPNWLKIMKPKKSDFDMILEMDFETMIPAHGSILTSNANKKIKKHIEGLKF